jgi:DNA-binding transcriptional LysR family regulator
MRDYNSNDLIAFLEVAREKSFTRAAARLGVSTSALSHTMRGLETRLGVRLLTRTTRSVSPTEAGERLFQSIALHFDEIDAAVAQLGDARQSLSGTIRITAGDHSARTILWPKLSAMVRTHPDIKLEIVSDAGLTDIVAERFDAGVRMGEQVAKDMIAVRIGPDMRMAVVGSPEYFKKRKAPLTPQDLTSHSCINVRMPTYGGLQIWEFEKKRRDVNVRVDGPLVFSNNILSVEASLKGLGLAYVTEDQVQSQIKSGLLKRVLDDWCPPFPGYHLYYPSRRQPTRAFSLLVEALRFNSKK